jgi:hypothetical protein
MVEVNKPALKRKCAERPTSYVKIEKLPGNSIEVSSHEVQIQDQQPNKPLAKLCRSISSFFNIADAGTAAGMQESCPNRAGRFSGWVSIECGDQVLHV